MTTHEAIENPRAAIAAIVEEELARPFHSDAALIARHVCERHGSAVAAVVYYGSCLRKADTEGGVLDFYVLVDSYRQVYDSRRLAWANAMLPPNVFYVELDDPTSMQPDAGAGAPDQPSSLPKAPRKVRSKYAVISTSDFAYAATTKSLHSIIWSRFSQPAVLVYTRDRQAREHVVGCLVDAVLTMVSHELAFLPQSGKRLRFGAEDLWQNGFRETYRAEFRTEQPETIAQLYQASRERYDGLTRLALEELARVGVLSFEACDGGFDVVIEGRARDATLRRWRLRRPVAKALGLARLIKSALTFGDWVPYALFKLGRHTGIYIEPTERQRRHPFIWGWPVIFRILRQQALR